MTIRSILLTAAAVTAACDTAEPPCDPATEACSLAHEFPEHTVGAGEEITDLCVSWTLSNDAPLWINTVESANEGLVHHSNWFHVPDHLFDLPDGEAWSCLEHDFNELASALVGGVVHAQSTQAAGEVQAFRPGAAILVPPHSRIVVNVHLLNASFVDASTRLHVRLDTIPPDEVTAELQPFEIMYLDLALPPSARSAVRADCDAAALYEDRLDAPFDARVHYLMPHYHELGDLFDVRVLGGERDGEAIYTSIGDTYGEPLGRTFEPPIDLGAAGARGLSFTCGFDNPRPVEVGWGVGDQEMCLLFGFAESRARWRGTVAATEQVADGDRPEHTGRCNVLLQGR